MLEVALTIHSPIGSRRFSIAEQPFTIGRSEEADITIQDSGLSEYVCSIHWHDDRIWILEEDSASIKVNGMVVPANGLQLANGDKISLGDYTTIWINIAHSDLKAEGSQSKKKLAISSALIAVAVLITAAITLQNINGIRRNNKPARKAIRQEFNADLTPGRAEESADDSSKANEVGVALDRSDDSAAKIGPSTPNDSLRRKLYLQMNEKEETEFVYSQARNVSRMMSNREYVFTDEVLPFIKKYVDGYARRVGNKSDALWGEDLNSLLGRARRVAPDISRAFNARGVPKVVGLYIPMIESEYRECLTSPVGAKGLFQFMAATASGYGVNPNDRCDVKRMAPAAARYIKDRIAEFGSDPMSVALGIAGYNRSPDSVRRDLSDVINSKNKERSFWTLIANSNKLDRFFQNENIKYVPKFFAAAIVGENPWAFGLQMNPLSSYTGPGPDPSRKD
jgi:Transglycosylase SLT domain/FHA domain